MCTARAPHVEILFSRRYSQRRMLHQRDRWTALGFIWLSALTTLAQRDSGFPFRSGFSACRAAVRAPVSPSPRGLAASARHIARSTEAGQSFKSQHGAPCYKALVNGNGNPMGNSRLR